MTGTVAAPLAGAPAPARPPGPDPRQELLIHLGVVRDRLVEELAREWPTTGRYEVDRLCHYALAPAGKLLRPVLLLESASTVGGDPEVALPAALGAECGHVGSLVHDDIMDGDELRRGRPSVQHRYGVGNALVTGDALIFALFRDVARCAEAGAPPDRVVRAVDVVARTGLDLCRGQSLEAAISAGRDFDLDGYLTVARLKTASYFRCVCEIGALLGGGTTEAVMALATYGERLGCAFQYSDDLLDHRSDSSRTGKPSGSDVRNRRMTLPVVLAERLAPRADRARLHRIFGEDVPTATDVEEVGRIVRSSGALAAAEAMAADAVAAACAALDPLPPSPARWRLEAIAGLAADRDS
jgi:geranylgeranyl diphosphate synthase type I